MMETEEEQVFEVEDDIMESEEEEEAFTECEEDEEEVEQLEEMRPPVVTSWMGPDRITVHGIMCIDDGIVRLKNQRRLDDCSICYRPSSTHGKHQMCCLPCGHMYGVSCIKTWLLLSSSSGNCPQCNTFSSDKDPILLYPSQLCDTAHQNASSSALFPFTNQGILEFKKYEHSRVLDAQLLRADDITHMNILVTKHNDLADRAKGLIRQRHKLTQAVELEERAESFGPADALERSWLQQQIDVLRSRASRLEQQIDALGRRTVALKRLVSALRQRSDALGQRCVAFESRIEFGVQMYNEHHKREKEIANAKQALDAEKEAAKEEGKGEKEAEKAAEKKLKDEETNDEKKVQASDTVDVPEEELVEDVAEEPEEEKVEVKAEPTTKTRWCLRVRSRSNRGKRPDSITKVIHKRKKSNNYMYYYAAGAAAVLTVPLAFGYTLYA